MKGKCVYKENKCTPFDASQHCKEHNEEDCKKEPLKDKCKLQENNCVAKPSEDTKCESVDKDKCEKDPHKDKCKLKDDKCVAKDNSGSRQRGGDGLALLGLTALLAAFGGVPSATTAA